jgi:hypothetical protein
MAEDLVAVFADPDSAARALHRLAEAGLAGARVVSPAPYPVVNLTGHPGPWRHLGTIALVGGLSGLALATALQVTTSQSLGIIVGGKPIISWPAFGVVMFELTMLFAGLSTFTAVVVLSAVARRSVPAAARLQVGTERIVVVVPVSPGRPGAEGQARLALKEAVEVRP